MKYSNYTIGNRSRDHLVCSAVSQPLRHRMTQHKQYQEYFLNGKDGRCVGLTALPPSCVDCLEIWAPQTAGTLRACPSL
jgi:hypothetical protein